MNITKTARGFDRIEFTELGGAKCSLQKSSAAENDYIWFGANDIGVKGFVPYGQPSAWQDITEKDIKEKFGVQDIVSNSRMHLSREQVKELLPYLQKFVKTGEIV